MEKSYELFPTSTVHMSIKL